MISQRASASARQFDCRGRSLTLGSGPIIMGILNVTPDSFYDGGRYLAPEAGLAQAEQMVREGAGMIDVGGQSTRPGFREVSPEEEMDRVIPWLAEMVKRLTVPVSVDTYKAKVARAALAAGVHVLNDIYGFQGDPELAAIAANAGCAVVLMHNDAAFKETAGDSLDKIKGFFDCSLLIAQKAGVAAERIVLDPGIGFGKTHQQNLEIIARLDEIKKWGFPVLLGASRKSTIGQVLDLPVEERLEGTLATSSIAGWLGVDFIRVHDVKANARAAKMGWAISQSKVSL